MDQQQASNTVPLDAILSAVPTLPRAVLSRLVARAIDRLDEIDGDPDLEDSDCDTCVTDLPHDLADQGDDEIEQGRVAGIYGIDQSLGPISGNGLLWRGNPPISESLS